MDCFGETSSHSHTYYSHCRKTSRSVFLFLPDNLSLLIIRTIGIEKPFYKCNCNIPVHFVQDHALQLEENDIKWLSPGISSFVELLKESLLMVHKENALLGG